VGSSRLEILSERRALLDDPGREIRRGEQGRSDPRNEGIAVGWNPPEKAVCALLTPC